MSNWVYWIYYWVYWAYSWLYRVYCWVYIWVYSGYSRVQKFRNKAFAWFSRQCDDLWIFFQVFSSLSFYSLAFDIKNCWKISNPYKMAAFLWKCIIGKKFKIWISRQNKNGEHHEIPHSRKPMGAENRFAWLKYEFLAQSRLFWKNAKIDEK